MRNVLGSCGSKVRVDVANAAKLIFQSADLAEARRRLAEFCCRERVIRIFPNDESALRLIGALLAE